MSEPKPAWMSSLLCAVIAVSATSAADVWSGPESPAAATSAAATPMGSQPVASSSAEDEVSIRNLQTDQSTAWNEHDAPAYARLFAEDGEVVTLRGWWWKGRKQIQQKTADGFEAVYRDSVLTVTDISVRLLTPSIAVAHVRWTMTGSRMPRGMPEPQQGIEIQVLQKKAGAWLIQSLQNTASYPERPFPRNAGTGRS